MSQGIEIGNFKFQGWQAILVLVAVVGYVAYSALGTHDGMHDDDLVDAVRYAIDVDRTRDIAGDIGKAHDAGDYGSISGLTDKLGQSQVTFHELIASEPVMALGNSGKIVVRATYSVPADGGLRQTRYFRVERAGFSDWRVLRETDRVAWWLAKM